MALVHPGVMFLHVFDDEIVVGTVVGVTDAVRAIPHEHERTDGDHVLLVPVLPDNLYHKKYKNNEI